MNADGSGIVCGGVTKEQKQTCDTFRMAPKPINVPHRGDFGTEKKG
jgi:hypothetical protein